MFIDGVSDKYDSRFERLQREPVIYVQMDTTGLDAYKDVITRLSILADDALVYDQIFKCDASKLTKRAAEVSGVSRENLMDADVTFADALAEIKDMLAGRLICCSNKDFMLKFFEAEGLLLDRDDVIDLKAIVGMMNHTYSRTKMEDVLDTLLPAGVDRTMPNTTWERNFKMYECACALKNMIS